MRDGIATLGPGVAAERVGGKAAGLMALGALAPPGLVVTRDVFDGLMGGMGDEIAAWLLGVDPLDAAGLAAVCERVGARVAGVGLPDGFEAALAARCAAVLGPGPYIVRSSAIGEDGAAASFAGQLCSVLGVMPEGLGAAVLACWRSRFAPGVVAYERLGRGVIDGVAVLIQPMLRARFGGVLFTRCPQDGSRVRVEWCAGHPEPLVRGAVTPGVVRLRRGDGAVVDGWIEDGIPLGALVGHALALAAERGQQLDVEWIVDEGGRLWLVQVRPDTQAAADDMEVFSNANMNENYPAPVSPLLYGIAREAYAAYFAALGEALGVSRARIEAARPALERVVGVHGGRLYYDLSAIHAALGQAPFGARLARYFDGFVGARGAPVATGPAASVGEVAAMAAAAARSFAALEGALLAFEAAVHDYASRWSGAGLDGASLRALVEEGIGGFRTIRLRRWTPAALADAATSIGHGLLGDLLPDGIDEGDRLALLSGVEGLASLAPVDELWALSRRARAGEDVGEERAAYLARWGFRCGRELMLSEPRLVEVPERLDGWIAQFAAIEGPGPAVLQAEARARRVAATARVRRLLPVGRRVVFDAVLAATQGAIRRRERARLAQARLYGAFRQVVRELGGRLVEAGWLPDRDAVLWLECGELARLAGGREMFPALAARVVALRRAAWAEAGGGLPERVVLPFGAYHPASVLMGRAGMGSGGEGMASSAGMVSSAGMASSAGMPAGEPLPAGPGTRLSGLGSARGRVTAVARVVPTLDAAARLGRGEVLVTGQTDPGWAPLFFVAGALVMERGGLLSHGAIVAREFGIPAVLDVSDACRRIGDGSTVTVDGTAGWVEVVA